MKLSATGALPSAPVPLPNRCSTFTTVAEEQAAREDAVSQQMRLLRKELPAMLAQLATIPDPRDAKKRRHKLTVLLLYGLLMFVFQFASRREANREMTRPQFMTTLRRLFPEIDTLPHADTLYRLLRDIDLTQLEQAHVDLVRRLIRGKSFRRYLINHCHPIAIDGSQKLAGDTLWAEELLQRTVGKDETRHTQYFVYVLEASLVFHNGLGIPLLSEFLEHALGDTEAQEQDCELHAFVRLSERLKTLFPRLPILRLLDGLYANGPMMQRCHAHHWQFMNQELGVRCAIASSEIPAPPPGSILHGCACSSLNRSCYNSNDLVRTCPRLLPKHGALSAGKGSPGDPTAAPTTSR